MLGYRDSFAAFGLSGMSSTKRWTASLLDYHDRSMQPIFLSPRQKKTAAGVAEVVLSANACQRRGM